MNTEKSLIELMGNLPISIVKVRFWLKIRKSGSTCNGNGYELTVLDWAWFRKRGSKILHKKVLGNGDDGTRCEG